VTGTSWDGTGTTWAATSGGIAALADPTSSDNAIFDANSGNVTPSGTPVCLSLNFTGYTGTFNITTSVTISGSLTIGSGMTLTGNRAFIIAATSTVTSNGIAFPGGLTVNATGATVTLADALLSTSTFILTAGTFDANNQNVTVPGVSSSNTNTRVLTMGSGTWAITGASSSSWNTGTSTNLTLNANTSTIKFTNTTNTAIGFDGGGKTFYDVWFDRGASTGTITVVGTNTFNSLRYNNGSAARTIIFPNVTTTIAAGGLLLSGSSGNLLTLARTGGSGTMTISVASGTICLDYLSISNSTATGGASFYAGAGSTDGGSNSGWTFTACPGSSPTTPVLGAVGNKP